MAHLLVWKDFGACAPAGDRAAVLPLAVLLRLFLSVGR
ncbi:hypothetical protein HRbin17_00224 [bacterium HR17]|uniref:Uncharacterized protein n=1 Tax=Candidatus Fervidibacter japonicus TaxID=2035412 RepID=A0A2H5X981_9BACT|nr:hypothetical protein HRbin17_00224 [bacterium HR17]